MSVWQSLANICPTKIWPFQACKILVYVEKIRQLAVYINSLIRDLFKTNYTLRVFLYSFVLKNDDDELIPILRTALLSEGNWSVNPTSRDRHALNSMVPCLNSRGIGKHKETPK